LQQVSNELELRSIIERRGKVVDPNSRFLGKFFYRRIGYHAMVPQIQQCLGIQKAERHRLRGLSTADRNRGEQNRCHCQNQPKRRQNPESNSVDDAVFRFWRFASRRHLAHSLAP